MDLDLTFSVAGNLAMAGWLLLIVLPRWRHGPHLIAAVVIPALLAIAYIVLFVAGVPGSEGGFGSLDAVATLFENRAALLAGWIHYLAFDLFIGAWEVRDAQRLRITHWLVIPCLLLTLFAGPAGLLLYLALRAAMRRRLTIQEEAHAAAA